jgi:exo-beta-1,3-glucanase (GH17 family)
VSSNSIPKEMNLTAKDILGNADYPAICYGGYRHMSRDTQPTLAELKEDMLILHALGFRILRTYNVHYEEATNLLHVISELKKENPEFEMYVMLGIWIDCKNAWTELPTVHNEESEDNQKEVARAVELANQYPDIVKILAVGNEAMVKWATRYYVEPWIILKWVKHLQGLKSKGELPAELWITSSDNFASWGGGDTLYHTLELNNLIRAVDYISLHTYPMHDTHYNPAFWGNTPDESHLDLEKRVAYALARAKDYAVSQYESVVQYMRSLGVDKPVHIGETGWASHSNEHYGPNGSRATDEFKAGLYYQFISEWSKTNGVSCFYFEAFDEQWKDSANPEGSENHFGLINLKSEAKFGLWDAVDQGVLNGLARDGKPITKTHAGRFESLIGTVLAPPVLTSFQPEKF